MRMAILALGIFTSVSGVAASRHHKEKVNPALSAIHKVYVKGNNEAAVNVRQEMVRAAGKYGSDACLAIAGSEKAADAVLEVGEQEHQSTVSGGLGSDTSSSTVSTMIVSGTLTDHQGSLLWADSERDEAGLAVLRYRKPEQNLLRALYQKACGSKNGDRK